MARLDKGEKTKKYKYQKLGMYVVVVLTSLYINPIKIF
jgi:hypothetical protein